MDEILTAPAQSGKTDKPIDDDGVRAEAQHLLERAKHSIAKTGHFPPLCMVICRRHVVTKEPTVQAECLLPILWRAPCQADFRGFVAHARAAAIVGDAYASILVVPRYIVLDEYVEPEKIQSHPKCRETLTMCVEWHDGRAPDQTVLAYEREGGYCDFDDVASRVVNLDLRDGNRVIVPPEDVARMTDAEKNAAEGLACCALKGFQDWVSEFASRHHSGPAVQS